MNLREKVAVVTGGGRGIGEAIALALAKEGANVVLAARTSSEINRVAEKIHILGRRALAVPTDISKEAEVRLMVERANKEFGGVDILINNAGIHGPIDSVANLDMKELQRTIDINLKGVIFCTKAVLSQMIRRKRGKIINISSTHGKRGAPYLSAYSITKAGIIAFTQSLAREVVRYKINVHVITPHAMDTTMPQEILAEASAAAGVSPEERRQQVLATTKWGFYPKPETIAPLVVFLASSESDLMTEQVLEFP